MTDPRLTESELAELEALTERRDDDGSPVCSLCEQHYHVAPLNDLTATCHACAHKIVREQLPTLIATARRESAQAEELARVMPKLDEIEKRVVALIAEREAMAKVVEAARQYDADGDYLPVSVIAALKALAALNSPPATAVDRREEGRKP